MEEDASGEENVQTDVQVATNTSKQSLNVEWPSELTFSVLFRSYQASAPLTHGLAIYSFSFIHLFFKLFCLYNINDDV